MTKFAEPEKTGVELLTVEHVRGGPLGFHEAGRTLLTVLSPGQTKVMRMDAGGQDEVAVREGAELVVVHAREAETRDPLDHDGNGRKGGSVAAVVGDEGPELVLPEGVTVVAKDPEPINGVSERVEIGNEADAERFNEVAASNSAALEASDTLDPEILSDEALRDFIESQSGSKPHHKTGRTKLLEQARAIIAGEAEA